MTGFAGAETDWKQGDGEEDRHRRRGTIRALERGLKVLRAIGQHGADPAALARATGIDRTTIYRILYTFEGAGYLIRNPSDHRFRLSREARLLGDSFSDSLWVTQIGAPEVCALSREVGWPCNLATFDGDAMLVRESTHRFCSMMDYPSMVGAHMSMASAVGQAFAAHVVEAARPAMVTLVARDIGSTEESAEELLAKIRQQGFAIVSGQLDENITSLAVPLFERDRLVGAVNAVSRPSLMPIASMTHNLLVPLKNCAERIGLRMAALGEAPDEY